MRDLRSVALKAWCLDAAKQTEFPLSASAPSEETPPRLPWGGVVSMLYVFEVSWKAGSTAPSWEEDSLVETSCKWQAQSSRCLSPPCPHLCPQVSLPLQKGWKGRGAGPGFAASSVGGVCQGQPHGSNHSLLLTCACCWLAQEMGCRARKTRVTSAFWKREIRAEQ